MKISWNRLYKNKIVWVAGAVLIAGALLLQEGSKESERLHSQHEKTASKKPPQIWTCSMHPQVQLPEPGDCPICGMDLIPVAQTGDEAGERQISFSEEAVKLAEIQTARVERKFVEHRIRMVGKVEVDETRLGYITAYVGGRLDRLYVDFTGVTVKKGDHMVYLYSPQLLAAQEELIQAAKAIRELEKSEVKVLQQTAVSTLDSARERLRLWGLNAGQIREIEERGVPTDHLTIFSPMEGIVIHKNAVEGMYVETGTRIYTIADLSKLWVLLDAYESDLSWIHYGQEVEFDAEAYPGETFKGKISFISPVLNEKTRTVKVRVNVANPDGRLKPGMFVRALVRAQVARGGKAMDPSLAGMWMCPMHPEVVKDGPGNCEICGMDLVETEKLGFVSAEGKEPPLVIPASAPLVTGERAVVYVKIPGKTMPTFEGREVTLGPRAGEYYLVKRGLAEGEEVVTRGNFKIDSALQIQAKPSMMNPEGGKAAPGSVGHHH